MDFVLFMKFEKPLTAYQIGILYGLAMDANAATDACECNQGREEKMVWIEAEESKLKDIAWTLILKGGPDNNKVVSFEVMDSDFQPSNEARNITP